MNADNPYAAPEADLTVTEEVSTAGELADRSTRFVAAFLDGIIGLVCNVPLLYVLGIWKYSAEGQAPPLGLTLASGALGFGIFVLIHGRFLKRDGQTIGKKMQGIRIVDLDGNIPDFGKLILLRYLPIAAVAQIPLAGPFLTMLDPLFIFRRDRRCLHDLIAGTKVVRARPKG